MGVTDRAPDGRVWKVRRTLSWPRWRKNRVNPLEGLQQVEFGTAENPLAELGFALAVIVLVTIFIVVFLPLILFLAELVVLVPAVVLVRRPWRVCATTAGPPTDRLEWRVRGWRGSREAVAEVARELGRGVRAAPESAE